MTQPPVTVRDVIARLNEMLAAKQVTLDAVVAWRLPGDRLQLVAPLYTLSENAEPLRQRPGRACTSWPLPRARGTSQ
jgi:hypothetical protein